MTKGHRRSGGRSGSTPPPAPERQAAASARRAALLIEAMNGDPRASRYAPRHLRHGPLLEESKAVARPPASSATSRSRALSTTRASPATARPRIFRPAVAARSAADRRGRSAGLRHAGPVERQPRRLELNAVFGPDVTIVPREHPLALAASDRGISSAQAANARRDAGGHRAAIQPRRGRRAVSGDLRRARSVA